MSQPRRRPHPPRLPRAAVAALLEAAKERIGYDWTEVEADLGIRRSTREQWLNGKVAKPPAYDLLRLARHLGVSPDEFEAALLDGALPAWVIASEKAAIRAADPRRAVAETADAMAAKSNGRTPKPRRPSADPSPI